MVAIPDTTGADVGEAVDGKSDEQPVMVKSSKAAAPILKSIFFIRQKCNSVLGAAATFLPWSPLDHFMPRDWCSKSCARELL